MAKTDNADDALLMKAEEWNPPIQGRSKLEEVKNTIFHLRYNKNCSYTAIKHFLAEAGIKTSTAALSRYFKFRLPSSNAAEMKPAVLARLASIKSTDDSTDDKQTHKP